MPGAQGFSELHKLIDRRSSDFRHWYMIVEDGLLSVYDIFNAPKVDDLLSRKKVTGQSLKPGRIDSRHLEQRFVIAYSIVQDHILQNEDPIFSSLAQKVLLQGKEILRDASREREYRDWIKARRLHSDKPRKAAEEAERARKAEEQKRKQLEQELEEVKQRAREHKVRNKQLEQQIKEAKEEQKPPPKPEPEKSTNWSDLFGFKEQATPKLGPKTSNYWADLLRSIEKPKEPEPPPPPPPPPRLDVTGSWTASDGLTYHLVQIGVVLTIRATNLFGIVVTQGQGTVFGHTITLTFQSASPWGPTSGSAQGQVAADGRSIRVFFHNFNTGVRGAVDLFR
jgi:flagellar motor protein MotB